MARKRRRQADEDDSLSFTKRSDAQIQDPHIASRYKEEARHLLPWAQRCALGLKPGQLAPKEK